MTTESPQRPQRLAIDSAVTSLKEIVTVVMGLTLTNTVVVMVTQGHYSAISKLSALSATTAAYSFVLIANIVRFYHGNMRHVDSLYGNVVSPRGVVRGRAPKGDLGLDFVVILLQSMLFAVTSFYARAVPEFILLFLILLAADVVWVLVTQQVTDDPDALTHLKRWMLNNILGFIALIVAYFEFKANRDTLYLHIGLGFLAINTVMDFVISWSFYFPTLTKTGEQTEV